MADELKAKGNSCFSNGEYEGAVAAFSSAIELQPENHVLYSNRSAAQASMKNYDAALEDAKKHTLATTYLIQCVSIKPDWGKGYSRLTAAHFGKANYDDAIAAAEEGLKHDPENAQLRSSLADARAARTAPRPQGQGLFSSPDVMAKLAMDPRTRACLGQPDFMAMLSDVQANPGNMNKYLQNDKFQLLLEVALGFKMQAGPGADGGRGEEEADSRPQAKPAPAAAPEPPPAPEEPMDETEKEKRARKAEATKEKEAGNQAYKARQFQEAISHYNRAWELYDEDVSFLTNRAAVYFEMGDYERCIEDCDRAVERGREVRADYKLVAKAMQRKGSALVRLDRLDEAVQIFNKSLTEHRNADTLKKLNECEKTIKERREQAYINMDLSNEEKDKGNEAFKGGRFPDAVKHYTEALKRGPPAVNPEAHKLHSNLAACYTKLGAYPEGVKAADKCLELCPSFVKGYSRKGALQFLMKETDKALLTYRQGLKYEPENQELLEGERNCIRAISKFASGDATQEEIKERQARSMQDPEIQGILQDPLMQSILHELQENPRAAQHHLKQPEVMAKINKLVNAGVVQMK